MASSTQVQEVRPDRVPNTNPLGLPECVVVNITVDGEYEGTIVMEQNKFLSPVKETVRDDGSVKVGGGNTCFSGGIAPSAGWVLPAGDPTSIIGRLGFTAVAGAIVEVVNDDGEAEFEVETVTDEVTLGITRAGVHGDKRENTDVTTAYFMAAITLPTAVGATATYKVAARPEWDHKKGAYTLSGQATPMPVPGGNFSPVRGRTLGLKFKPITS